MQLEIKGGGSAKGGLVGKLILDEQGKHNCEQHACPQDGNRKPARNIRISALPKQNGEQHCQAHLADDGAVAIRKQDGENEKIGSEQDDSVFVELHIYRFKFSLQSLQDTRIHCRSERVFSKNWSGSK